MAQNVHQRIKALSATIEEIIKISGCPGASIGILHHGEPLYFEGFGFRDVEKQLSSNESTIYYLSSLSKTFTASRIAQLVEQGKLEWTTPVSHILPTFRHWDKQLNGATIVDFLSHRTGLAPKNFIWNQEYGRASLRQEDTIPMVNSLGKLSELGTAFKYSNWGYALAGELVLALEKDQAFGDSLQQHIFGPLGMSRSMLAGDNDIDNRAESYQAFTDGRPFHFPQRPCFDAKTIMHSAVGVQSCVRDLLLYYKALLSAAKDQSEHNTTRTPNNPLVQVTKQLEAHIAVPADNTPRENSYAMGWARTELPAKLGSHGMNPVYVEMPEVATGVTPTAILWHQGSNACALSFAALIPETQGAIVVLTNGVANNDTADWIGQLLLEAYLNAPERNDYLELASLSAKNSNARWPKIREDLAKERTPNTYPKPLSEYVGFYYNEARCFYIEVDVRADKLRMCFQGNHEQWYPLDHHEFDCFTWVLTRNENVRRGRIPLTWRAFYQMIFKTSSNDRIEGLVWDCDGSLPDGEVFTRFDGLQR